VPWSLPGETTIRSEEVFKSLFERMLTVLLAPMTLHRRGGRFPGDAPGGGSRRPLRPGTR
jgi:hypothetical protein